MSKTHQHYHLMGIGGVGVSGLARVLRQAGHTVSGCDSSISETSQALIREGIEVEVGHDSDHLDGVDVLIASTAIKEDNLEMAAAIRKKIPVWRRIQIVGEILKQGISFGVTGSHGKTSTSSMLTSIFLAADLDPTVLLGAELKLIGGTTRVGKGKHYLAEIDESDPLFQYIDLDFAILTNLEPDHISSDGIASPNYHATYDDLKAAVRNYAAHAKKVIYNAEPEWALLEELTRDLPRLGFGIESGDLMGSNVKLKGFGSTFSLVYQGTVLGDIELSVPGEHNVSNALAAAAAALAANIPFEAISNGLRNFVGAGRRFELLGHYNGALIVDDYAHNATKLEAVLKAATNTGFKVKAVFQPHRFGRSEQEFPRYGKHLEMADEVILLDVYGASEQANQMTSAQIVGNIESHLKSQGKIAQYLQWDQALAYLRSSAKQNELILFIGAGNVNQIAKILVSEGQA